MSDTPIDPQDYIFGVKVVDIGDIRVARGMSRRPYMQCRHTNLVYNQDERRVWCADCETNIEGFDAFKILVEKWDSATKELNRRRDEIKQAETLFIRSRAAKVLDEHWRKKNTSPCCPHCNNALLPEDMLKGLSLKSKAIEIAKRAKKESKE